jgi:hypothetical protein
MKPPVIYRLIVSLALMTDVKFSHAGLVAVIRLSGHNAVSRAAVTTAGKRVVIVAAGGIKNIANTVWAGRYIG